MREQRPLDSRDFRRLIFEAVCKDQLLAADDFGAQTRDLGLQRVQARLDFSYRRRKPGLIEPRESLTRRNTITFTHHQFAEHAAVNGLDDLHAATGDDLAAGPSHLVDLKYAGPDDERRDADRQKNQYRP